SDITACPAVRGIGQWLPLSVRVSPHDVATRVSERLNRRHHLLAVLWVRGAARNHGHYRFPMPLLGKPGCGRSWTHERHEREFRRGLLGELPVQLEHFRALPLRPGHPPPDN